MTCIPAPLAREVATETVRAVESAIAFGSPWPPGRGKDHHGKPAALSVAAKMLGIGRSTLCQRLVRAHELYGLAPNGLPLTSGKAKAKKADAPRLPKHDAEIIRLRDENRDLRQRLEGAHKENMAAEGLADILAGLIAKPVNPPAWLNMPPAAPAGTSPHIPVVMWADWHVGEVVEPDQVRGVNAYSVEVFRTRLARLLEKTTMLCRDYGPGNYPGIVIPLMGDLVSGGLHPELQKTDELRILPSILEVRDALVGALIRMADEFGAVFAPAVCGNHGRLTKKPEFKGYQHENADWVIYQLVARALADRGETRVTLYIPPVNEALFRVFGHRFLAVHGDMLGVKGGDGIIGAIGPIKRGEIKVSSRQRSFGDDYDTLLMGHWHQELFLPRVIVANSLKGYDEYAMKALSAPVSLPSQPLFFVHPKFGITSYSTILLEDPAARESAGWVSIPAGGA